MRLRALLVPIAAVALLTSAGCGDDDVVAGGTTSEVPSASTETLPARQPDVTGVVARSDAGADPALSEASDPYFEGMGLLRGDPVILDDVAAEVLPPSGLEAGDEVAVWVGDACAESYPVQCQVLAIQVRR
ncbi:MAG: hypothetical protein ACO1PW_00995 [Actinomycetota bacterium]